MRFDTEGIVVKEIRLPDGNRILHLFTKKTGKISAGTSINEKGRSKATLALRPFTVANYSIDKRNSTYFIRSAEFKKAYFNMGENIDRFIAGSYVVELTEKVLPENEPAPAVYSLLMDFLSEMELREKRFSTLIVGYEVKLLKILGIMPELNRCSSCESRFGKFYMNIPDGNIIGSECLKNSGLNAKDSLIYPLDVDILEVLRFLEKKPLMELRKLALDEKIADETLDLIKKYISYHLDIGPLKSESMLRNCK